ncbi:MAG: glutamyl-tRNA reductase, partial [Myxococcales bacterium]
VTVLATCNRCEVYAEVDRFHGSVETISRLIAERAGADAEALLKHLYVHYDDGAVSHLLNVASGLDSMVIGESQILGQVRESLRAGQETSSIGPALNLLFQQALRVGKRTHAETDIDKAAPSVVTAALAELNADLSSVRAVVVGAGSMAGLAVATLARAGAQDIAVANRTSTNAERLAAEYSGHVIDLKDVPAALAEADLLISCTGATGTVIDADTLAQHVEGRQLAILDLALPRDVDPVVAERDGVQLVNLESLAKRLAGTEVEKHLNGVRRIVAEELAAFLAARRAANVTPTVVALRTMATGVVDSELERLLTRLPDLDEHSRREVERTLRRTADKLLHQPT